MGTCSVSTKLATLPSLSMPRMMNRRPWRRQLRRETNSSVNGDPLPLCPSTAPKGKDKNV